MLSCLFAAVVLSGCGSDTDRMLSQDEFEHIYGELIFLAELYRDDSLALHRATDSLLQAHETDTVAVLATARALSEDTEALSSIYRNIILRLEGIAAGDTATPAIPEWER
jgi:hypothetical protein